MYVSLTVFTVLLCIPLLIPFRRPKLPKLQAPKMYELPFYCVYLFFIVISVWRCFYMPPYSRDVLSGPELLAEYAVREKTMISSVFKSHIDLSTSNNYFKSPYLTCLQIIYKILVCPFGQMWLSVLFVSFVLWIFTIVRARIHPLLACIIMLLFLVIPEMYAYTFVILYDYSNMVFFFAGFYFLVQYLIDKRPSYFTFSVFLFGIATYIRTESLILIALIVPLLFFNLYRRQQPILKTIYLTGLFFMVPAAFWFLNIRVFVKNFVPLSLNVSESVTSHLADISPFFKRLEDICTQLIFSNYGASFYGNYIYFFLTLLAIDLIWPRKFNRESLYALYGVGVIYFGMGLIGYLLPLADLLNTTKRGLFKAFPMILLYMANSGLLQRLSEFIKRWENPPAKPAMAVKKPATAAPAPAATMKKGKK